MNPKTTLLLLPLLCSGCSRAPSVAIFGAFFPAWMISAVLGMILALVARALGAATGIIVSPAPPLLYPMLSLLFGALVWIVLFRG